MDLVDVHAHLDHDEFSADLAVVLKRAAANGVRFVLAQGINHETNEKVLVLAEEYALVLPCLGLYPSEASNVVLDEEYERKTAFDVDTTLAFIEKHIKKIVAIGEVGMDLKESSDEPSQRENFRRIVRLAKKYRKPIIVHSRKAEEEILNVLDEEDYRRVVMHCFMGKKSLLRRAIQMGLYFSIPAAVCRVEQFQVNVAEIPLGQLLTETDAPYLGVMRDLRSEPAQVRDAVKKIAELKRLEPEEVANQLFFNYQKLFQ